MAIGLAGRDERGIGLIGHGPQVLLGPLEHGPAGWTELQQVGDVQAARHMPARRSAEFAAADSAAKTIALARRRRRGVEKVRHVRLFKRRAINQSYVIVAARVVTGLSRLARICP